MFSGPSSSTLLGAACTPGQTGASIWHMLQRDRMTLWAAVTLTACALAMVEGCLGPAPESHATASIPAAATPQVHHGLPLPSWRQLKKCRMTGPTASTMATMSQLKRVAKIKG